MIEVAGAHGGAEHAARIDQVAWSHRTDEWVRRTVKSGHGTSASSLSGPRIATPKPTGICLPPRHCGRKRRSGPRFSVIWSRSLRLVGGKQTARSQLPPQIKKIEVLYGATGKVVVRYQLVAVVLGVDRITGQRSKVRRRFRDSNGKHARSWVSYPSDVDGLCSPVRAPAPPVHRGNGWR